jgi:hypothetical protein
MTTNIKSKSSSIGIEAGIAKNMTQSICAISAVMTVSIIIDKRK